MDIFISYASEQRANAEEIALALRAEGHRPFFDRTALPEGEAYNARIREAVRDCDLFLFLVSPESISAGRYTLTELGFAEEKWRSPAGRVLPVMVRPTDSAAVPAYLRAVVILRPAGNVPAEVVAAVERLSKPAWLRALRRYAIPLAAMALIGVGVGAWRAVEIWRGCEQAQRLAQEAEPLQAAGDYAAAWGRLDQGLTLCPGSDVAADAQERLAMDWLRNARVTVGRETFRALAERVQPVLARAALARDGHRAADALAHLGWAQFLRSRDGGGAADPAGYYRRALQRDPRNGYAHAFWGHYTLVTGGDAAAAREHFDQALATSAAQPFVRKLQISALSWRRSADKDHEIVRVANQMRAGGEPLRSAGADSETVVSSIWDVYHTALVRGHDRESFQRALPPNELLDTFLWLFPAYENSSNRYAYLFMLAQLQERNGDRAAALSSYRALLDLLAQQRSNPWGMADAARAAVARLRSSG